jgi:hypothetical protein
MRFDFAVFTKNAVLSGARNELCDERSEGQALRLAR